MMKLYFLGTGTSQGIPVIGSNDPVCKSTDPRDKRLRTSASIDWDGVRIQIDCGPDFRQQMLNSKCTHIDGIVFTHEHADHTAGLDDIRPFCFSQGKPMPIYAQKRVLEQLQKRFDYVFETENRYPGAPSVEAQEVEAFKPFYICQKKIEPLRVLHGKLEILGYKFDKLAYLTDVKQLPDETIAQLVGIDCLVINALRHREHPMHNNLKEAMRFVELIQPKQTYIIHIGYELGFHKNVQESLPKNVYLAFDNLEIEL